MRTPTIILILWACSLAALAQQQPQFNLHMFNRPLFNPAATGIEGALKATVFGRNQWIGYRDEDDRAIHPATYGFTYEMPVYQIKSGAGLSLLYDRLGYINSLNIKLHYAYHYEINRKHRLSAGLSLGFNSTTIDFTQLVPAGDDPILPGTRESATLTDLDLGVHYQGFKRLNLGFAANNLLGTRSAIGGPEFQLARHFYLSGSYDIIPGNDKKSDWLITPSVLLKMAPGALSVDLSGIVTYREMFWGGLMYRYSSAAGLLAGITMQGFRVGISYDYTLSKDFAAGSRNSLEFIVQYSKALHPPVVKRSGYNTRNM